MRIPHLKDIGRYQEERYKEHLLIWLKNWNGDLKLKVIGLEVPPHYILPKNYFMETEKETREKTKNEYLKSEGNLFFGRVIDEINKKKGNCSSS